MPAAAVQRRTVGVLVAGQVLVGVGVAAGISVGTLLAEEVSGSAALSGLAQTGSVLGAAVLAVPLARLSAARGRRVGLATGYGIGATGCASAVAGGQLDAFWLLMAGTVLFGGGAAAGLQARYAAADLATPQRRARDLSTVVWATTVGAVIGPNLADPASATAEALGLPPLTGAYLWSIGAFTLAAAVVVGFLRPDPLLTLRQLGGAGGGGSRPLAASLAAVRRSPHAVLALTVIAVAHTVMVSVMVMTPLHMSHGGAELSVIGLVISGHVAGMYALSPLFGWLADRRGRVAVTWLGAGLLLCALGLAGAAPPHASVLLGTGLFALGLGWSASLVAGSALLTESVPPGERPGVQGAADLVMGLCGATGGAMAGVVVGLAGYGALNLMAAVLVVPLGFVVWRRAQGAG
jgi:MFS family permease